MSGQNRRASHQGKVPPAQVCEYGGRVSRTECCLKGIYMPPIASKAIGGITTPTRPHYKTDWLPPFLHSPPKRESEGSVNGILYQVTGKKCTRLDEDHRIGLLPTGRRPFIPLKGGAGGWEGRRIRRWSSEQRRMAVVQLGENALHRCLAENCGTFLDAETVTILLYGGQFLIVQVNHLTMSAPEGSLAHFKIFRIRNRRTLLFPCQNCLSLEKNEPGKKRFHTLGETPTTFPVAKISIFSEKNGLNHGFRVSKGHFCPFFG